jgi:hypothetical protein
VPIPLPSLLIRDRIQHSKVSRSPRTTTRSTAAHQARVLPPLRIQLLRTDALLQVTSRWYDRVVSSTLVDSCRMFDSIVMQCTGHRCDTDSRSISACTSPQHPRTRQSACRVASNTVTLQMCSTTMAGASTASCKSRTHSHPPHRTNRQARRKYTREQSSPATTELLRDVEYSEVPVKGAE